MNLSCARCSAAAASIMSFDYAARNMWIADFEAVPEPGSGYLLCATHAGRLSPPVGWTLIDRRSPMARLFAVPS